MNIGCILGVGKHFVCEIIPTSHFLSGCIQMQGHQKKKIRQMVQKELRKSEAMSEEEELQLWNVWQLELKDRWRLYR